MQSFAHPFFHELFELIDFVFNMIEFVIEHVVCSCDVFLQDVELFIHLIEPIDNKKKINQRNKN